MRRRKKFNQRIGSPPFHQMLMITFLIFSIFMVLSIVIVNEGIKPVLMEIAKVRVSQISNQAMGIAVSKQITEDLEEEEHILFETDENGRVEHYIFNAVAENRVQRNVQYRVENFLKLLEDGEHPEMGTPLDMDLDFDLDPSEQKLIDDIRKNGLLVEIPLGQALGLPILANLGPKIPVKIEVLGAVRTQVKSQVVETGINGAVIDLKVHIEIEMQVVIPFASEPHRIEQDIPISKMYHPGDVPYYYHNGSDDSNLSVPIDPNLGGD